MGFRTGSFAKVWEVNPISDTNTKIRISISRKNKNSGEYEQDFSGFVNCVGTAAAKKAACLTEGARIKLGDTDVTTRYDREKKIEYVNYKVFSFDLDDGSSSSGNSDHAEPQPSVDEGIEDDSRLPF